MNREMECLEAFISRIKEKYNFLNLYYYYDETEDVYFVWHDNEDLEYNDEEFPCFVGKLMEDLLYRNGLFNVTINYDYKKPAEKKVTEYCVTKYESYPLSNIECNYGNIMANIKYDLSIDKCYKEQMGVLFQSIQATLTKWQSNNRENLVKELYKAFLELISSYSKVSNHKEQDEKSVHNEPDELPLAS